VSEFIVEPFKIILPPFTRRNMGQAQMMKKATAPHNNLNPLSTSTPLNHLFTARQVNC
jgi:hypothetical protein